MDRLEISEKVLKFSEIDGELQKKKKKKSSLVNSVILF